TPLTHDDIEGVYAGLRPLLAGESEETSKLSREHAVARVSPGLVAIAGGKYTTYRVMAADAVDAAVVDVPERVQESITDKVPLVGADGYHALVNQADHLASDHGLHPYRVRHLLDRYGSLISDVLGLAEGRPDLLKPIEAAPDYLRVEVVYAATDEGALHLEDVLARRTRISIEYPHRGVDSAEQVADLMAEVLGWTDEQRARAIEVYRARVEAERDSQAQPTDEAADAERVAAPEARGSAGPTSSGLARSRCTARASRPSATRRHSRVTRPPTPSASRPPRRGTGWPNPPPEPLAPCRIPVGCRTPRGRIRRGRGYGREEKPWRSVDSAGSLGPVIVDRTRVLRTPRLVLRAFVSADLDPLHAIRSREDVNRYLYECPMSREDVAAKLAERIERYSTLA